MADESGTEDPQDDTMREDIEKSWAEQLKEWVKKNTPGGKQKNKIDDILGQDPYAPKPPPNQGTRG